MSGEIFGSKGNDTIVGSDRVIRFQASKVTIWSMVGPAVMFLRFGGRNRFSITEGEGVDTPFSQSKDVIQINVMAARCP